MFFSHVVRHTSTSAEEDSGSRIREIVGGCEHRTTVNLRALLKKKSPRRESGTDRAGTHGGREQCPVHQEGLPLSAER